MALDQREYRTVEQWQGDMAGQITDMQPITRGDGSTVTGRDNDPLFNVYLLQLGNRNAVQVSLPASKVDKFEVGQKVVINATHAVKRRESDGRVFVNHYGNEIELDEDVPAARPVPAKR